MIMGHRIFLAEGLTCLPVFLECKAFIITGMILIGVNLGEVIWLGHWTILRIQDILF